MSLQHRSVSLRSKTCHGISLSISMSPANFRYSNPIENIFSNLIPVVGAFPILGCHIMTALVWISIVIITTVNDHSGHHLPFLHSSEIHDYHHLTFNSSFSIYGIMDLLHNTHGIFTKSPNYKHHQTLYTLKCVRDVCRDAEAERLDAKQE